MRYYSTNEKVPLTSFEQAVIEGLPADNGLYMPESIPNLDAQWVQSLKQRSLQEIGLEVARKFISNEIPEHRLEQIVNETLEFDIPLVEVEESIFALELFHGPTCAFKDVGARFLARCLGFFSERSGQPSTILVATSGDTGSAVAHGFYKVPNVDVIILYPKGKVSEIQERQLTTLGENITALEVAGSFDDCQALVKQAFLDSAFKEAHNLTSANSINVARLIPQSFYYFHAVGTLNTSLTVSICVPSGNYGNLTAGLFAKKMGLPVEQFIAASNANDIVPSFLEHGTFTPRPSVQTISNAMDVGNPSNFYRISDLYNNDWHEIRKDIAGCSFSDEATKKAIVEVKEKNGYQLDPHGAVGYLGLKQFLGETKKPGIFLETAHPAKFMDTVEDILGIAPEVPLQLRDCLQKNKNSIQIEPNFEALRDTVDSILK